MDWNEILDFARGPFFYAALMVFVAGLAFRLVRVLGLGWHRDRAKPAGSRAAGVAKSYGKGFIVWPFVPWVKQTFAGNAVTLIAGGIFHLGLFVTIFLGTPHMLWWKSLLGFGWPSLPLPIIDLQVYLGGKAIVPSKASRILVLRQRGLVVGLMVPSVQGMRHFNLSDRLPNARMKGELGAYVYEAFNLDGEMWPVFSMTALAADPEFRSAAA